MIVDLCRNFYERRTRMAKIGIVLSGCSSKVGYERGCLSAIIDYFGLDSIKCVSSASAGSFIAQAVGIGHETELEEALRLLDSGKYGRHILGAASNSNASPLITKVIKGGEPLKYEHYVCIWNFTKRCAEYIPFHKLKADEVLPHMLGAMSVPVVNAGVVIDGDRILDGAFVDNIPVQPLLDKDLDYIFCIYFDNKKYVFESPEFDKKIIKLYDFPNNGRFDLLLYTPGTYDALYRYAYEYTSDVIKKVFENEAQPDIYESIAEYERCHEAIYEPRFTADIVLNNINIMTNRYFKHSTLKKNSRQVRNTD